MIKAMNALTTHALLVALTLITACTNVSEYSKTLSTTNTTTTTATGAYNQILKSVQVQTLTTTTANQTASVELDLSVDPTAAGFVALTNYCGTSGTNPCDCQMTWNELNTASSITQTVSRTKKLPVSTVQSSLVKCTMDQTFYDEISTGTVIQMQIVPEVANITGLNSQPIGFKKGTSTTANGDFLDSTLTPFINIHRYSCLYKRNSPYEILNQYATSTATQGSSGTSAAPNAIVGSQFCSNVSGSAGSGQCATARNGFSAQSYFRNLYVQSSNRGHIVSSNNYYDCPSVVEPINYSAGQTVPSTSSNIYPQWPLDTTFALATTYSSDWSVGIRSGSVLYVDGNTYTAPSACTGSSDTSKHLNERGISIQCLGYAKKPNLDGTCGTIVDNNGRTRPMTRLRRYRTVYPATYQGNGAIEVTKLEADEVLVADRLVVNAQGVPTGDMVYGPKPCNFSWFDHEGVINRNGMFNFGTKIPGNDAAHFAQPGYVATSNYYYQNGATKWSVNPDGLIFPNVDHDGVPGSLNNPSCSATLPVVEFTLGSPSEIRLLTINRSRTDVLTIGSQQFHLSEVHVKPIDAWTPTYLEDTSLQACVPLADPYLEPPMYFYERADDVTNAPTMEYCSKAYPTQNPYWVQLNGVKAPTGSTIAARVVNYPGTPGTMALPTPTPIPVTTPYAPVSIFTSHNNIPGGSQSATHYLDIQNNCSGTKEDKVCLMTMGASDAQCALYLQTSGTRPSYLAFANSYNSSTGAYAYTLTSTRGTSDFIRNTCDRTVVYDSNTTYFGFPMQATDPEISAMLFNDWRQAKSFSCQYSVSTDATKVNAKTPTTGCCGVYNGSPILNPILSHVITGGAGSDADGHLEPFLNPNSPNNRFCGNPVQ